MDASRLQGVFAPVTTPFAAWPNDAVDLAAFGANVRALIAQGVHGIVIAGSTGEAAMLDEGERAALAAAARREVPADRLVILGCGGESTRVVVARTRAAQAAGVDAALVVAPHYYANAMSSALLRTHYLRVADASPIPVILYNIPKYAHFALSAELVGELAQHPNVIGIKDSSGDLAMLGGYLTSQSATFSVLTGAGGLLLEGLEAGARGGILAVADFAAPLALEVYARMAHGDRAGALAAQEPLRVFAKTIVAEGGVPAVKAAVDAVGMVGGACRGPLEALSGSAHAAVAALLAKEGAAVG